MGSSKMSLWAIALAITSLPKLAFSQSNTPCPGLLNNPYVDSNGQTYIVWCGYDGITVSTSTVTGVASFAACMALCDTTAGCVAVSYANGACYLKPSFTGIVASSNVETAALCSVAGNPPYPSPVAGVNASTGCGKALPSGVTPGGASTSQSILAPDGRTRTYLLHVPASYDINKPAPLIITFHGQGESGAAMESESGYSLSNYNPYGIAIYPNGINATWSGDPNFVGNPVDDIGMTNAIFDYYEANYCIDTGRLFASGHSNGGGFTNVLACDPAASTRIAAFGANSAAMYTNTTQATCINNVPYTVFTNTLIENVCSPNRSNVPFMEVHGDADGTIGYTGGGRRGYCLPAIPHAVTDWSTRDGESTSNITTVLLGGNATKYEFGASSGLQGIVTHYKLKNWIHAFPSIAAGAPLNGASIFWNFFYRFTNPAGPATDYSTLPLQCGVPLAGSSSIAYSPSSSTSSGSAASSSASSAAAGLPVSPSVVAQVQVVNNVVEDVIDDVTMVVVEDVMVVAVEEVMLVVAHG